MNSLRARIAVVLIASITLVVCLATVTTFLVIRRSGKESFIRPIARQLAFIVRLSGAGPNAEETSSLITSTPAEGEARDQLGRLIRDGLAKIGLRKTLVVTRPIGETQPIASIEIADGRWLQVPLPEEPPPPETLIILGGWMLLILLGTTGISLFVAHRVTRPLVLLEAYAEGIGPSGELQPVPEIGPAEVRATARALNRLNGKLRHAVESRMRLVAAAGHDLRTPLTRMRLRAEFLDDDERGKWLHNLDELERIADSAILLVREETSGREPSSLRLDMLVRTVGDELNAMRLPVCVVCPSPISVMGSPLAMTRALRNLIVNAANHGGGAAVLVEARGDEAIVVIEDDGPGIPAELLDRVFEPFFRVDQSRRQSIPGAGLGLAIAREIVGRAGGRLILQNRPGGGLRQEVVFPLVT